MIERGLNIAVLDGECRMESESGQEEEVKARTKLNAELYQWPALDC